MFNFKRKNKKNILLIDGNSLIYRCYFATYKGNKYNNNEVLKTSFGVETNAVFLSIKFLLYYLKNSSFNIEKIIFAFDHKKENFRKKIFKEYKENRKKTDPSLINQIIIFKEFLKLYKINYFSIEEYEADDIIGSLSNIFKDSFNILILTGDNDLLQLIDESVIIGIFKNLSSKILYFDKDFFFNKWGFEPKFLVDWKSLAGDPSDNVKGLEKVGKVTSTKLIKKFGTIENLINNLNKVENIKLKNNISKNIEKLKLYKKILKIYCKINKNILLNNIDIKNNENFEERNILISNFLKKYEMFSLLKFFNY